MNTRSLKQCAQLLSGGTPSKGNPTYWNGDIPWLTPKDMASWFGRTAQHVTFKAVGNGTRLAPQNALFIAVRGMSLHNEIRIVRSDRALTFNQDIKAIVPHGDIDIRFLYHALQAKKSELLSFVESAGHGTGRLPTDKLESLPIPDLNLRQQQEVAAVLNALDDKIELNKRMNETLEAMARAIFKDWFVDFGPTRAKIDGRAPYLAPEIWALFPERLDDEGKPEGWRIDSLGEHILNYDSKRVPVSGGERAKRPGPYPYHGATGVMDYIDAYLFDGTYVLVGEDGSVVKENGLAFTQYVWGKFWVNNHAHVLQGKGAVSNEHVLMYFQHELVTPFVTGAVQLKLSQGRMNSMPFMFAGERVCRRFAEVVAPLFAQVRANADRSNTLSEARDLLLPKLMSGEIRVKEAEKMVEPVA